jgi:hypothetical protein
MKELNIFSASKRVIYFIFIFCLVIICTSCVWQRVPTDNTTFQETTGGEAKEEIKVKYEPSKVQGETVFTSSSQCLSACQEAGYETGNCLWPEKEAGPSHYYLGSCQIDPRQRHCGGSQCNCYCYSSTTPPVQH